MRFKGVDSFLAGDYLLNENMAAWDVVEALQERTAADRLGRLHRARGADGRRGAGRDRRRHPLLRRAGARPTLIAGGTIRPALLDPAVQQPRGLPVPGHLRAAGRPGPRGRPPADDRSSSTPSPPRSTSSTGPPRSAARPTRSSSIASLIQEEYGIPEEMPQDRPGHLQPPRHGRAARHRRHQPLRGGAGRSRPRGHRPRVGVAVQHPAQRRAAAHADRPAGPARPSRRRWPGRRPVDLLRPRPGHVPHARRAATSSPTRRASSRTSRPSARPPASVAAEPCRPMHLSGRTRVAAVIGSPVRHSLSPALHNAAFAATGLDWAYVAFEVAPGRRPAALDAMRALGLGGLSVTMPHKADVGRRRRRAQRRRSSALGAVNCVVPLGGGRLRGESTDGDGLRAIAAATPASTSPASGAAVRRRRRRGPGGRAGPGRGGRRRRRGREPHRGQRRRGRRPWPARRAPSAPRRRRSPTSRPRRQRHLGGHGRRRSACRSTPPCWAAARWWPTSSTSRSRPPLLDAAAAPRLPHRRRRSGCSLHQAAIAFELWTGEAAPAGRHADALAGALARNGLAFPSNGRERDFCVCS